MIKDLIIKKEYGIELKQVKEGLRASNNSAGWNSKVDNCMIHLGATLEKEEQLFFMIAQESKGTINTN